MDKELEDQFYERVALEIANSNYQPAPMARAVEKSAGNADLAKSLYVKFRVKQLAHEYEQEVRTLKEEVRRRQLEAEETSRERSRLQSIALEKQRQEQLAAERKKPERIEQELRRKHALAEMKLKLTALGYLLLVILLLFFLAYVFS